MLRSDQLASSRAALDAPPAPLPPKPPELMYIYIDR